MFECIAKCGRSIEILPPVTPLGIPWKETWGWLCSPCANEPAKTGSRNTHGIVMEPIELDAEAENSRAVLEHLNPPKEFQPEL